MKCNMKYKMSVRTRNIICISLVMIFSFIFLSSCASAKALVQSTITGLPFWLYAPLPSLDKGKISFVGAGEASSVRQAELLSYSNIIEQISNRIGVPLGQEVYRELSVLGTIKAYGLTVEESYYRTLESGIEFYVYVVADEHLLEEASSEETLRKNEISKKIEDLVLEGDEYVKEEVFTKGISCYLQAMVLSYEQDYVKDEYSYYTLLDDVSNLLSSLEISITSANYASATCNVNVTRKTSFFPSKVKNAGILASYKAVDMKGDEYDSSFVYTTGTNGSFSFDCQNFTLVRKGSVLFKFDFETVLQELESKTDKQAVATLREVIEQKEIEFDYNMEHRLGSIAVCVVEFNSKGYVIGNSDTTDYMCKLFEQSSANVLPYYASSSEEEDILYDYTHNIYSQKLSRTQDNGTYAVQDSQNRGLQDCILICRFGQIDFISSQVGGFAVNIEGTASLYDTKTGVLIYSGSVIYATAFGETLEEATNAAYEKISNITYTLLKAQYV